MTELKVTWTGNSKGKGIIKGNQGEIPIAIPKEVNGSGEGLNPKELLTSSASSCFFMTFVYMIESQKLPITDFSMETKSDGLKDNNFTITHYPIIELSESSTDEDEILVQKALEMADKNCAVGNFLKNAGTKILLKNTIKRN